MFTQLKFVVPRHGMKNKNTQTKSVLPSMSRGSQYKPPKTHWIPVPRDVSPRSQGTKICSPRSLNVRNPAVPNCEISSRSNPRNLSTQNPDSNPGTCKQSSISPSKRNLAPANLERALAEPSPPRLNCRLKRPKRTAAVDLPLFQDDLIDIIGESNDMRLRLMRSSTSSSPQKEDHPSCMNLFRIDRQAKPGGLNKIPPWK
ncbi:hypothetical protein HF086_003917 [Spodoptera exigua]|uniref:Uncharacterized protein n=1 Tax=Spodoptera exigua TaxID=7107 RepID=A0A922SLD9_SPOEX|nr:hypothetical protein HF086_003917 [Spodoptera exigua]